MQTAETEVPRAQKEIKLTPADEARFWAKVDKSGGADACWLWTASKDASGYGHLKTGKQTSKSHRVAWVIANGQVPHDGSYHGICVCHRCDVPACCNVAHLFLGTNAANVADREKKGRSNCGRGDAHGSRTKPELVPCGEDHGNSKLTASQVVEIRALYATGDTTHRKLAAQFGVLHPVIGKIIRREMWKHV